MKYHREAILNEGNASHMAPYACSFGKKIPKSLSHRWTDETNKLRQKAVMK